MPRSLVRLVFRSRSCLRRDDTQGSDALYQVMVRNNRRDGIVGCVAQPDGHFVQVIEGKELQILTLFEKIKSDPRHDNVVELGRCVGPAPLFDTFAIARPDPTPLSQQSFRIMNDSDSAAQVTALLLGLMRQPSALYRVL